MRKLCLLVLVAVLLMVEVGLSADRRSAAQEDSHYFPETGITLVGRFYDYWQANGELPRFGYPISAAMYVQSEVDNNKHMTQYFERAVFELHADQQPPNDVQLTLLGSLRYHQKYPEGADEQQASTDQPRRFAETGKVVGGKFRIYWEQRGGLAQFGYPISDAFSEVSDSDGKAYMVQYFERAEFELHPENAAPNDVLLTQLGRYYYKQRGTPTLPPSNLTPLPAYATPTPNQSIELGPVKATPLYADIRGPWAAGGDYVIQRMTQPESLLFSYNFVTNVTEDLDNEDAYLINAIATDGHYVTWRKERSIISYDLVLHRRYTIAQDVGTAPDSLILEAGIAYYTKPDNAIYSYSFADSKEQKKATAKGKLLNFTVNKGNLLWDERDDADANTPTYQLRLQLDTSDEDIVAATAQMTDFLGYRLVGDNIAFLTLGSFTLPYDPFGRYRGAKYGDLHRYQISKGWDEKVAEAVYNFDLGDDKLVWATRGSNEGLYLYRLDNPATIQLGNRANADYSPLIKGTRIVWRLYYKSNEKYCTDPFAMPVYACYHYLITNYNDAIGVQYGLPNFGESNVKDVLSLIDENTLVFNVSRDIRFYTPEIYVVRLH